MLSIWFTLNYVKQTLSQHLQCLLINTRLTVKTVNYVIIIPAFLLEIKGRRGYMYLSLPTYLILIEVCLYCIMKCYRFCQRSTLSILIRL